MDYDSEFIKIDFAVKEKRCKICNEQSLDIYEHVAKCRNCGVLLNFPYVFPREIGFSNRLSLQGNERDNRQKKSMEWHINSGHRNHFNFTQMVNFASDYLDRDSSIDILDFGGGGRAVCVDL